MAGNELPIQITVTTLTYSMKDAIKEVKRQQKLPYQHQSKWVGVKSGNKVYFSNF